MKKTFWDKRIPTLISMFIIGVSIAITSVLVKSGVVFVSRADITQIPQNVKVTNISDTSFTISYTTEAENIASVDFGIDNNLGQTALDDRDQDAGIRSRKVHNFTLHNLKPYTRYFFTIVSGQNTYLNNNIPYETTTAPATQITLSSQEPITGRIVLLDGQSPKEAIVYANIDKAQEISSLSTDGSYSLSLNSLLLEDLSYPITLEVNSVIKMIITNGSLKSNVVLSALQINPVPVITLSHDYDFTVNTEPTSSKSSELLGFPSIISESASPSAQNPSITVPKKDQGFTDQKPLFRGTTAPNETVQIIIRSPTESQIEVTADSFGNWFFRPESPLSEGKHTISIQTKNKSGILQTLTQSFVVFASGTQIQGAAPSPTTTIIPTPTAIPSPTPLPTFVPTPTSILPTATIIPTPTPTSIVLPTIGPETPLGNASILITGIFGFSILALGCLLFIKTQGGTSS